MKSVAKLFQRSGDLMEKPTGLPRIQKISGFVNLQTWGNSFKTPSSHPRATILRSRVVLNCHPSIPASRRLSNGAGRSRDQVPRKEKEVRRWRGRTLLATTSQWDEIAFGKFIGPGYSNLLRTMGVSRAFRNLVISPRHLS